MFFWIPGVEPQTLDEWKLLIQLSQLHSCDVESEQVTRVNGSSWSNSSEDGGRKVDPESLTLMLARTAGPDPVMAVLEECGVQPVLSPHSKLVFELQRVTEKRQRWVPVAETSSWDSNLNDSNNICPVSEQWSRWCWSAATASSGPSTPEQRWQLLDAGNRFIVRPSYFSKLVTTLKVFLELKTVLMNECFCCFVILKEKGFSIFLSALSQHHCVIVFYVSNTYKPNRK